MQTLEIIGFKRANLGKSESKALRSEGNVPCVLYGGEEQVHFHSPMILFRELIYTNNAYFVKLNIEGTEYDAILQDVQFHPVSEVLLHADFLLLSKDKPVKMNIPVKVEGTSPGVIAGGRLALKLDKVIISSKPENMPEAITINVSELLLGRSIRVRDVEQTSFKILNSQSLPIVSVAQTRSTRQAGAGDGQEETEAAEA